MADATTPPRAFGRAATLFVAVLAFLCASTPVRQTDFWMQAAAGRAALAGRIGPADPLAFTLPPHIPAPGLAGDALLYLGWSLLGDGVVVAKALLAAGIALAVVWVGGGGGLAAGVALLAVLASAPWLGRMSPDLFSYALVPVLVGLLERWRGPWSWREAATLAGLFAGWAMLDGWVVVGLVAAGVYALGGAMVGGRWRLLVGVGCLVAAGVALVVWAGQLPPPVDILGRAPAWDTEPLWRSQHLSAFDPAFWRPGLALSVAGVALILLAATGTLMMAADVRAGRYDRAVLFACLLLLAVWRTRAMPLFALAAGPLLAQALTDFLTRRPPGPRLAGLMAAGRALTVIGGVVAAVAAWPGWLLSQWDEPRRWRIDGDPSLSAAAAWLREHPDGGRVLNLSPEAGAYLAWDGPKEGAFVDSRLGLFPREVADAVAEARAVALGTPGANASRLRETLRRYNVTRLLLTDSDARRFDSALLRLRARPGEWRLLTVAGRSAVFAPEPSVEPAYDLDAAGSAPAPNAVPPSAGLPRPPRPAGWEELLAPRPRPTLDREHAATHLALFEAAARSGEDRAVAWLSGQAGGLTAGLADGIAGGEVLRLRELAAASMPMTGAPGPEAITGRWRAEAGMFATDDGPPAALLVAGRSARRAVAAWPEDGAAWVTTGEVALRSSRQTAERAWAARWPSLRQVRLCQATAAFATAVLVDPQRPAARPRLASLYEEAGALDLALDTLEEHRKHLRAVGRQPSESAADFAARLDPLNDAVTRLSLRVGEGRRLIESGGTGRKLSTRAGDAVASGLSGEALKMLLAADYAAFGDEGMMLQFELLLVAGRPWEVLEWLEPRHEPAVGSERYHWLRCRAGAAAGDYATADTALEAMAKAEDVPRGEPAAMPFARLALVGAGIDGLPLLREETTVRLSEGMASLATEDHTRRRAELIALRGLLALEAGRAADAAGHLREALRLRAEFAGRRWAEATLARLDRR